ncbi:MAG: cache domain-containing protein, partial [Ruminiclostridium sp.]|nr:cache domain-containing protein [Ruminiclostridium sp.]
MKNNKISFKDILKHQSKGKTLLSVIIVIFVVTVIVIYNVMLLRSVNENMVSIGRISAERSANTVDSFLSECITAVSVAESTLDEYIVSGKSEEEILDFMMQFDKSLVKTINQKTTKLYAYIGGNIYDGKGEIRKPDYVIDERPWYKKAMWNKGNFVLVDPYVDVHSGQILMTISKTMSDGKSVIAFDISLEYIQEIVDNQSTEDSNITEIVLDSTATVVGHSDKAELGKNYRGEKDTLGAAIGERIDIDSETNFNISFGGHRYIVYIVPIQGRWCSVSVIATSDQYMPIRIMFLVSILASVVTIIILVVIMIRSGSRDMLASRLNFQLSSAADIYMSLSDIDLVNGTLIQIKDYNPDFVKHFDTGKRTVQDTFNNIMRGLPKSPTKQAAIDFVDLSTLDARLVEKNSVSLEYLSYENRWVRGRFVASERKPDGKLSHVLWMLEDISSEKRERDRLTEKAEKLTAQLSSAADIYISLCDLDIPNNSAVAIKNANPAIAKAVEDGKYHMQETFNGIMGGLPESPTKQLAIDFCDLSKIDEKLADANTMTVEYLS